MVVVSLSHLSIIAIIELLPHALLINQCAAACGAKRFKWPLKSIGKVSVAQLAGGGELIKGGEGGKEGCLCQPALPPCQTTFPIKSDWAKCQRELCAG